MVADLTTGFKGQFNFDDADKHWKKDVKTFLNTPKEQDLSFFYYIQRKALPVELRLIAQRYAIETQLNELPTLEEMQEFSFALETSPHVVINDDQMKMISLEDVMKIVKQMPIRICETLPARTLFVECAGSLDEEGRIRTDIILQFVNMRTSLIRYMRTLALYDEECSGYVSRRQMETFLRNEVFPAIDSIFEMNESLLKDYLKTVLSMFFFFLDPHQFGRCRIGDVVLSGFIENMIILQRCNIDEDPCISENWFSAEKTSELLSLFAMLDVEKAGYLTEENLRGLNDGAYTNAFISRLFEIHVKDDGRRMSYDEFITFQIATEHLAHPSSIKYYFKILDLNEDGYLTSFELKHFYNSMRVAYCDYLADSSAMPSLADYMDSLFDLVQSSSRERVSLNDVLQSKQAYDFLVFLINHREFARLENAEDSGVLDEDTILITDSSGMDHSENVAPLKAITEENETSKSPDLLAMLLVKGSDEEGDLVPVDDSFSVDDMWK